MFSMGYEAMGAEEYPVNNEAMNLLLDRANTPEMHTVIDCSKYKLHINESQQATVKCSGEHYLSLDAVVSSEENTQRMRNAFYYIKNLLGYMINEKIPNFRTDEAIHIGFMCREGRHQSVALCRITSEVLKRQRYNTQEVQHLSQATWEGGQSCCCECCDANHAEKEEVYETANCVFNDEQ